MIETQKPTMPSKTSRPSAQRASTSHSGHRHKGSSSSIGRVPSSVGSSMPPALSGGRSPATSTDTSRLAALRSPGIQNEAKTVRTPSPNYFGLMVETSEDPRSAVGPKGNWSPPTSSIRSFNASSPQHVPVDSNPAFEAFRRQAEQKTGFNLSHGNLQHFATTPLRSERRTSRHDVEALSPRTQTRDKSIGRMDVDEPDSSHVSSESARASQASMGAQSFFDLPRQESPASIGNTSQLPPSHFKAQMPIAMGTLGTNRNVLSRLDARHPRLSLPQNRADPPSPHLKLKPEDYRAETLPSPLEAGPAFTTAGQLKNIMGELASEKYLLLDLRVAPQYSQYRIKGALNLCIPTTLLKRPSFNIEKLKDTFKVEEEKARFSKWKSCEYIIVYDARSSEKKDAQSAINTLKKFDIEGWQGKSLILRGGIEQFRSECPALMDTRSSHEMHAGAEDSLPVAGGCQMPESQANGANPFFSNIRQNMDLVGGVGQIDIKMPDTFNSKTHEVLPNWMKIASATDNHGKVVSDKFLRIEQDELARMQKALSSRVSYGTPQTGPGRSVQIAGFEKGVKNRYNNIWPFEHSRVHLPGKEGSECDYVNASHIKASWSNKRYIASQGPLPATFEDFWSVVWDQDVRVIVMLTAESEGGQLKCHSYWNARDYGQFRLNNLSEKRVSLDPRVHRRHSSTREVSVSEATLRQRANSTFVGQPKAEEPKETPYVVVRKFTLSHASEPFKPMREITQLHYSSWPDFGAPAQPSHLLGLVELSNSMHRAALNPNATHKSRTEDPEDNQDPRPTLVHCSAGCGRTGTFCTVDSVIDMLKRQRKEQHSGVTPMEVESSGDKDASYWSRGKPANGASSSDWVFNQDIDLIEKTVEDFRTQRISMVQSLVQYVLCYETILEWISQQRGRVEKKSSNSGSGSDVSRSN